jgi:glycosyltransferase involved in cell wall biosynthesis
MLQRTITLCAYDKKGAVGGPVEWAADFAGFLHDSKWEVHVLILCRGGTSASSLAERLALVGISHEVLDSASVDSLEAETEWILAEWKRKPSAYVVANLVLPALYAARWIRDAGARTVAVIHSDPDHDSFYADVLATFAGTDRSYRMNAVVAVSNSIASRVRSRVPGAVTVIAIPCGTRTTQARAKPPEITLRLIYAGRLVQKAKRIREVVTALLGASRLPGVTATICGDGEEREWVIDALSGQTAVSYAGVISPSEMHATFGEHHAVVLLSDFEGLPISVMEAMACGLVPICLDSSPGVREIVQNGINGLLVSDRNESFLAAVRLLEDPTEWARLSGEARRTATERYSHDVVMLRWIAFLEGMGNAKEIDVGKLPSRIQLRGVRPSGAFESYPPCRPSDLEVFGNRVRQSWSTFRIAMRPRSRLRDVVERTKRRH